MIFAVLLAGCAPGHEQPSDIVDVPVNEGLSLAQAYHQAGLVVGDGIKAFDDEPVGSPSGPVASVTYRMRILHEEQYGRMLRKQDTRFRAATARELFALVRTHREMLVRYKGVCAPGQQFHDSKGNAGYFAVVSDARDLGIRQNCHWVAVVEAAA